MNYGTLITGKPQWLKEVERYRKPVIAGGITYQQRDIGTRQCIIVRDYINLINSAEEIDELLCVNNQNGIFIDLGDAPKNHNLIINIESGKVYVNGHIFTDMVGIVSLGDGSWAVVFDWSPSYQSKSLLDRLAESLVELYETFLDEVYVKCANLSLIENNPLHQKSIMHLIRDDLPKGRIISKKSSN